MSLAPYCTIQDVQNRMSASGVSLRIDDDTSTNPNLATQAVLEEATVDINFYLQRMYDPVQLALSVWVKYRTVDFAVMYFCQRRMNSVPKSVQAIYDRAVEHLKEVQLGKQLVPDVSTRKTIGPVLSQPRARLWPVPHTVIERNRSTGKPEGYSGRDDPIEVPFFP